MLDVKCALCCRYAKRFCLTPVLPIMIPVFSPSPKLPLPFPWTPLFIPLLIPPFWPPLGFLFFRLHHECSPFTNRQPESLLIFYPRSPLKRPSTPPFQHPYHDPTPHRRRHRRHRCRCHRHRHRRRRRRSRSDAGRRFIWQSLHVRAEPVYIRNLSHEKKKKRKNKKKEKEKERKKKER